MQFRFVEYDESKEDYFKMRYLASIFVKDNYDAFLRAMKDSVGLDINIRDEVYSIEKIALKWDNDEDKYFCVYIMCVGY